MSRDAYSPYVFAQRWAYLKDVERRYAKDTAFMGASCRPSWSEHPRSGAFWSPGEDAALLHALTSRAPATTPKEGAPVVILAELARSHGRTIGAIENRLITLMGVGPYRHMFPMYTRIVP